MNPNAAALISVLLRYAAQVAPRPVTPRELVSLSDRPREDVASCLAFLFASGALQEAPSTDGSEIAFSLTEAGAQMVRNPAALERYCAAAADELPPMDSGDDSAQRRSVRQVMMSRPRPYLVRLILAANIAVFLWGLILAGQQKAAGDFLNPIQIQQGGLVLAKNPAVQNVLIETGSLRRADVAADRWWRLLTCCFVHLGLLHLAMNMYALWVLGQDIEWLWGPVRFAVIYLLSGFAGSCAALTTAPAVVGASGAICGLFGAQAVWLFFNRRYLPPRIVRSQVRGLVITGVLLVLISLAGDVSGMGHLGGAVAGAMAAVLLHFHRFGNRLVQAASIVGLLAVAGLSLLVLKEYGNSPLAGAKQARRDPRQEQAVMADLRICLDGLQQSARRLYQKQLQPLLEQLPARRDADEIRAVLAEIARQRKQFQSLLTELERLRPFTGQTLEEEREAAADYFGLRERLLGAMAECLQQKSAVG